MNRPRHNGKCISQHLSGIWFGDLAHGQLPGEPMRSRRRIWGWGVTPELMQCSPLVVGLLTTHHETVSVSGQLNEWLVP